MNRSDLIETLSSKLDYLAYNDVEQSVKRILEIMSQSLANGNRIEIRGFGAFSLHYRPARIGRNPRTGEPVKLSAKFVPHFKPGKELRKVVAEGKHKSKPIRRQFRS